MSGPHIDEYGTQRWYNEKKQYHRTDGPAIIWPDLTCYWYTNGTKYHDNKSFQKAANLSDEDMIAIVLKYGNVK
jgi:hypothetical protein